MQNRDWIISTADTVLVTGANGFIGSRVVRTLLDYGFGHVRCFVRPSGNIKMLTAAIGAADTDRTELVEGNLLDRADCERAVRNVKVIFHLAAGIDKSFAGCFMNSALTTRNLLDASLAEGVLKRFVNVSSFTVYSNLEMKRGSLLDENTPLETDPTAKNDAYCFGKLKQEEVVLRYHREFGVPYVILRPGAVYGPGKASLSGRIGIDTFGVFLHLGGSNQIPLTYVDNCADAISLAGLVSGVDGEVFNVVDDDLPNSRRFLRLFKQGTGRFISIPLPYPLMYLLCSLWEKYSKWSAGQLPPIFNVRRCSSDWKGNRYSNEKLKRRLGWKPKVAFDQASRLFFDSVMVKP